MKSLKEVYERAGNIREMFEVVRDAVRLSLSESRAGIDIGLVEMGNGDGALLSAFYPVGSNVIVMNKTPLRRMAETQPALMKPYVFTVLLHEYLHSLGYLDEQSTRAMTHRICEEIFNGSVVTDMAKDLRKYFPYLLYPGGFPASEGMQVIETEDADYIG